MAHIECGCGASIDTDNMFEGALAAEFQKTHAKCADRGKRKKGDSERPYLITAALLDDIVDVLSETIEHRRLRAALRAEMKMQE